MIELINTKSRNYDILRDGKPIKLKVSRSNFPYGFNVKDYGGTPSKNLVISLCDQDDIDDFHTMETEVIEALSHRSEEIFKSQMSPEEIGEIFNSNI